MPQCQSINILIFVKPNLQISSGQGPSECELAVSKMFNSLKAEYPDIEILSSHAGREKGCNKHQRTNTDYSRKRKNL